MEALRKLTSMFKKKTPAYTKGEGFLSVNEMDSVFGGKPEDVKSTDKYWWFDDSEITDTNTLIK